MRDKIKDAALTLFDKRGFHNTGIRDIAAAAGCSLPTMYYYFKNKEGVFDTIVCEEYEKLNEQINEQLPEGLPLVDMYYFSVMQRRMLTPENKKVFRLALKTILGMEGSPAARERLKKWDGERKHNETEMLKHEIDDETRRRLILRMVDSMLLGAVLFEDDLTNDDIRAELELLFNL